MGKVVMVSAVTAATVVEVVVMTKVVSVRLRWLCMVLKWVGGDEGGGMMMVAVDLWWGRGLGWRGWPDGVAGKVGRKKVAAPEVSPEIERRWESSVCED
ncbi:hypothetical protein Tco_0106897 [Tanacetum coccineum]